MLRSWHRPGFNGGPRDGLALQVKHMGGWIASWATGGLVGDVAGR